MKKYFNKMLIVITIIFLLITSINISAIAEYIKDEVVNFGVVLKITSEKDSVKSGEKHKVRIKNSYANPNDEDYATCKIYLTDLQGNPNNEVELQGLIENKMVFQCENNEDLTVTVELKEEKDENGEIIYRYIEYILPQVYQ